MSFSLSIRALADATLPACSKSLNLRFCILANSCSDILLSFFNVRSFGSTPAAGISSSTTHCAPAKSPSDISFLTSVVNVTTSGFNPAAGISVSITRRISALPSQARSMTLKCTTSAFPVSFSLSIRALADATLPALSKSLNLRVCILANSCSDLLSTFNVRSFGSTPAAGISSSTTRNAPAKSPSDISSVTSVVNVETFGFNPAAGISVSITRRISALSSQASSMMLKCTTFAVLLSFSLSIRALADATLPALSKSLNLRVCSLASTCGDSLLSTSKV